MAINTGNTDYNLVVTKTGVKNLRIRWSRQNNLQVRIQVFRPGDGKNIYTKTYKSSVNSGDETITVPYFGEYQVLINVVQGYGWDRVKRWVTLTGTHTSTKTYTQSDVNKWKAGQLVAAFTFSLIGLTSRIAIAVSTAALSLFATGSTIWRHDTQREGILAPRVGWKLRTIIETNSSGTGVKYSFVTLNQNNVVMQVVSSSANYLAFNF